MGCLRLTYAEDETLFLEQEPEKVEPLKLEVWVNPEREFLGVDDVVAQQGSSQDPFQQPLTEFLQFYFGDELRELNKMAADQGGRLTWYIDDRMKYTTPRQPGSTAPLNDGKRAAISLNPVVFTDARLLYTTVAHELVHARDILNGNNFLWTVDYGTFDTNNIMEHHAYLRSAAVEAGFGVNYGSAAAVGTLGPLLPIGFKY